MAFELVGKTVPHLGVIRSQMNDENRLSRFIPFDSDPTDPRLLEQGCGVPLFDRSQLVFF
jgi:hypothetical protein